MTYGYTLKINDDTIVAFDSMNTLTFCIFFFSSYIWGDGLIQREELQHVMRACMDENGMKFSDTQIDDLTRAMFEDADPDNRGG